MRKAAILCMFILAASCLAMLCLLAGPVKSIPETGELSAVGEQRTIVILIEFADLRHRISRDKIHEIVFVQMNKYFSELSYGRTWVVGDVTDWYLMPGTSSNYAWGKGRGSLQKGAETIMAAIRIADKDIDFSKYGRVIVVTAGSLGSSMTERVSPFVDIMTDDGVRIKRASLCPEVVPLWIWCHEFAHNLGLPDLFDIRAPSSGGPFDPPKGRLAGSWDLMSLGFPPSALPGLCAWSKIRLGWIPPERIRIIGIGQIATVKIDPLEMANQDVYALKIPLAGSTYYLVEVRQRFGCTASSLPDCGVLISWIDDSKAIQTIEDRPVRVIDANPGTDTLDDATFDARPGKNSTFSDPENGLAVAVLHGVGPSFKIHITTYERRSAAIDAWRAILRANDTISRAKGAGRTAGLEMAEAELAKALSAFDGGSYEEAIELALGAGRLAEGSAKPPAATATATATETAAPPAAMQEDRIPLYLGALAIIAVSAIVAAIYLLRRTKGQRGS